MANNDLVNSLLRGMEMVKLVGRSAKGVRLSEVTRELGLKQSTAHNLLRTLEAGGFLDKRDNLYFFGHELSIIARSCENNIFGTLAEKAMFSLYRKYPEYIIIFGVARDDGVAQTMRMSYDRPGLIQHLDYELYHPYTTAAGLIGLAFSGPAGLLLQEERRPFDEFGAPYWGNREELNTFLQKVRQERVAVSPFERDQFTRTCGAVLDSRGRLIAVIGVSAPGALPDSAVDSICDNLLKETGMFFETKGMES